MGAWGKPATARIPLGIWAKSYNVGGSSSSTLLIADMEIRPIMECPKRAHYGDSGVENGVFGPAY